jgi:hypothetical protein
MQGQHGAMLPTHSRMHARAPPHREERSIHRGWVSATVPLGLQCGRGLEFVAADAGGGTRRTEVGTQPGCKPLNNPPTMASTHKF